MISAPKGDVNKERDPVRRGNCRMLLEKILVRGRLSVKAAFFRLAPHTTLVTKGVSGRFALSPKRYLPKTPF